MSGPYFIETLARNGDVLHRHQVDTLPIRLGRGYDNDFIVDDDYAAPHHAIVEAGKDGALVLRDLGTRNGVIHRGKRTTSIVLTGDTAIRLGHTTLRVRRADCPVAPELVDRTMHGWEGVLPGSVGVLLIGACALLAMRLVDTQPFQLIRYLLALAYGIGAGLLWAGIWAFANRLFWHHARLGRHLFIAGCALAALMLFKLCASMLAYAFSFEAFTRYGSHVAILIVAGVAYFHLCTVRPQLWRRFRLLCLALAVVGSGLALITNVQRHGHLADELFMSVLLPPSMRASPDHSVDEFMGQVGAMQRRLDEKRRRDVKDQADED